MTTTPARAALTLLLLAACRAAPDKGDVAPPATSADSPPATPAATRAPHVFDPDSVRVGDTIAGMRIEAMDVQRASDGGPVGTVRFAGQARVSGRFGPHVDSEVDAVCFFADPASAGRLPRFPRDERRPWFCFADTVEARRLLATPVSGGTSIVIDRYTYHFAHSDVVNEARLVRVDARP